VTDTERGVAWVKTGFPPGSDDDEPTPGYYLAHYENETAYDIGPAGALSSCLAWARERSDRVIVDLDEPDGRRGRHSAGRSAMPGLPDLPEDAAGRGA
jgi:hypothetical protein